MTQKATPTFSIASWDSQYNNMFVVVAPPYYKRGRHVYFQLILLVFSKPLAQCHSSSFNKIKSCRILYIVKFITNIEYIISEFP